MPRVSSMKKKMMAHPVEPGSVAMASGYTLNTRPGPAHSFGIDTG